MIAVIFVESSSFCFALFCNHSPYILLHISDIWVLLFYYYLLLLLWVMKAPHTYTKTVSYLKSINCGWVIIIQVPRFSFKMRTKTGNLPATSVQRLSDFTTVCNCCFLRVFLTDFTVDNNNN